MSRRTFFTRARIGVLAVAGAALFGVTASYGGGVVAKEDADEDKNKKKNEARDKDRDAKEKEQADSGKSSEKKSSNSSNTKKKTKKTNGDSISKKKKKNDPVANSPFGKYVVDGKDQYGCEHLPSQADAQAVLRLDPHDPNNLDKNKNGIACDGSDAFNDGVVAGLMMPPFDVKVVPRP